jgi:hypothetical protein
MADLEQRCECYHKRGSSQDLILVAKSKRSD